MIEPHALLELAQCVVAQADRTEVSSEVLAWAEQVIRSLAEEGIHADNR